MNQKPVTTDAIEAKDTKKTDMMLVDPNNIIIDEEFNVRKDYGDIEGLMNLIVEHGQIEPVSATKVRGEDKYILTDGFRRMRAIKLAIERGYDIPFVKLLPSTGNMEERVFMMVITGVGKQALNVLEEGEAYKRLIGFGYEAKEIAKKVSKSTGYIQQLLKLSDAPKRVKNAIERKEISATTVMQLLKDTTDADELINLIEGAINEVKKGGATKKVTAKNVAKLKTPVQKLKEAYAIAEENGAKNLELMFNVISELSKKDSTAESFAELFK